MEQVLDNGRALEKFAAMCVQQGVKPEVVDQLLTAPKDVLGQAAFQTSVLASKGGYVASVDAMAMANLARAHGAGRYNLDDVVDPLVGFVLNVAKGDEVALNQPLLTFHHQKALTDEEHRLLQSLVTCSDEHHEPTARLLEQIESRPTKP